jgi:signal transduction histidine kinase
LISQERIQRAQLEQLLAERKRLADFLERKVEKRSKQLHGAHEKFHRLSLELSHDLRGPLRTIRSYADLVATGEYGELESMGTETLARIGNLASKLEILCEDLLNQARSLFGQPRKPLAAIDLNEVFEDACEFHRTFAEEHRANISKRSTLHVVAGRYVPVLQIIGNLLMNAIKSVPEGRSPEIEVWTEEMPDGIALNVQDNGSGLPATNQASIFERFVSRSLTPGGTGLGLSILQNAVQDLDGEIQMDSREDVGTVFRITLKKTDQVAMTANR